MPADNIRTRKTDTLPNPHSNPYLNQLRKRALSALNVFKKDHTLVHGEFSYRSAHLPPAEYGVYSISLITPETPIEAIARAKIVFVECMERRVALPAYRQLVEEAAQEGITPEEILVVSPGGGGMQENRRRERALQDQLMYVAALSPNLQAVVVSGHTSDLTKETSGGCGAAKHFCGGEPLVKALKATTVTRLFRDGRRTSKEMEETATDQILPRHTADLIGDIGYAYYAVPVLTLTPNEDAESSEIRTVQAPRRSPASRLKHIANTN